MGKRHRERRRQEKKRAKVISLRYKLRGSELGELRRSHASKAEIRHCLIQAYQNRLDFECQIITEAQRRATADIQAEEDARVFAAFELAAATL